MGRKRTHALLKRVPVVKVWPCSGGGGVGQLVSAWISEQEVPGLILGDFNVSFNFPQSHVAIALNTHKTEH